MASFSIDRDYLVAALTDLVRIDSVNPSLVPGVRASRGSPPMSRRRCGRWHRRSRPWKARAGGPGVVGRREGSGGGRSVMLNAHVDTVGSRAWSARSSRYYVTGACTAAVRAI